MFLTLKVIGVIALLLVLLAWWKRDYIKKISTSGHLTPPPGGFSRWFARQYCRGLVGWQVGKVKVIGAENLNVPGPILIAPNHGHFIDPMLFPLILERPARLCCKNCLNF